MAFAVEAHRRAHHRPGERPAPGLVDADHAPRAALLRAPLEMIVGRLNNLEERRRIGGGTGGHADTLTGVPPRIKRPYGRRPRSPGAAS